jgi:hypothetical protein
MKKVLLPFLMFACILFTGKMNAQSCAVSSPTVSNISTSSGAGGCTVTFDLTFAFAGYNGNKWKAIIIWNESDYNSIPSNFYGSNGKQVPNAADINGSNALATISINSNTSATQTLSTYPGDNSNPTSFKPGLAYINNATSLTIKGITVTVANCSSQIKLKADVGASNAASFNSFGCLSKGELSFVANEPIIHGLNVGCSAARQVAATFISTQTTNISFKLFKDIAPFGQFTAADTTAANLVGGTYATTTSFNSPTNDYRSNGAYNYNVNLGERFDVWVVAYAQNVSNVVVALVTNSCSILPVSFTSFSASRNNQTVALKWETASEQNSKGFYVQRNVNGEWKDVAFVFSRADAGNSSQALSYAYNDQNNYQTVSYYRLLQVDLDGKGKYSEVRTVKGIAQSESKLMLFPNPGTNGKINVMFNDETSPKEVVVYDANGRVVKSYKNVVNNSLMIEQLKPGVYNVQVRNISTQIISSEKFIIQN